MTITKLTLPALCLLIGMPVASAQAMKQDLQQKLSKVMESVARNQAALR